MLIRPGINLIRAIVGIAVVAVFGLWFPLTATALVLLAAIAVVTLCAVDYYVLRRSLAGVTVRR